MKNRFRILSIIIFTLILMIGFNDKVFAAKWSDLTAEQQNEYIQYADKGATINDVETICKYSKKGESKRDGYDAVKYLFVYKGNHYATVSGSEGRGTNRDSNNGTNFLDGSRNCIGANKVIRGIRNWSANKGKNNGRDGVLDNLDDSMDAYLKYEIGECPTYMAEIVECPWNPSPGVIFYFSNGKLVSSYSNLISWADEENSKGDKERYDYFNVPLVASDVSNITNDLECHYAENGEDEQFYFTLTSTGIKNVTKVKDKVGNTELNNDPPISMNTSLNFIEYLRYIEQGKCPAVIHGCEVQNGVNWYLDITGDTSSSVNGNFCKDAEGWQKDEFLCTGDNCSSETICKATSELYQEMENILTKYNDAEENSLDRKNLLDEYNRVKNTYNETCVSILKTQDYNTHSCLSECLIMSEKIADLETEHHLRSAYGDAKCNIGEQVVDMIYNVLKWGKYIAPVLVIILSILDFIKAMAAQSDDEMKKAQGRFVKRLIAAALLFLIPLIINFALKTFGFYNSACDITDLFSSSK